MPDFKAEFVEVFNEKIKREGADKLIEWLEKSDFFSAPASTRFHGAYEGGLCEHSLNVYKNLKLLCETVPGFEDVPEETIAISALLHDVTKVNCYKPDSRNVKNEDGIWERVPCYKFEEKFCFGGHGAKSVFLIERFMKLTLEEAVAIYNHMGSWNVDDKVALGNAYGQYPFAYLLHVADGMATYFDENDKFRKEKEDENEEG